MSLAPRIAGVGRRFATGFLPGAASTAPIGVGFDGGTGGPIGLKVELFLNGVWTDISAYVYYRDKIKITRGKPDETSQVQPQTAALTINNRDGRFSPRNPLGPYYGSIGRNTPIRISRMNNGIRRFRFAGEVPAWPTTWDISGSDVYVQIQAAGMLRRLTQGAAPLKSALLRYWTLGDFSGYGNLSSTYVAPVAYWPCEDGTSASFIASGLQGGQPMTLSGQAPPTFASNTVVPGSDALPLLSASIWTGNIPPHTVGDSNYLNLVISVPATGAFDTGIIASLYTSGLVARADLQWGAANGGSLQLTGYDASGNQVFTSGYLSGPFAGKATLVTLQIGSGGYVLNCVIFSPLTPFVGELGTSRSTSGFFSSSPPAAAGTRVVINPLGQLNDTAVGHVAYQAASAAAGGGGPSWAFYAWNDESPGQRYTRLCSEQNINGVLKNFNFDSTYIATFISEFVGLGYQAIDTFPNLLQQIPDTSFSPLFEARDQVAMVLRSHLTLYNQAPVLALDYSQHQLSGPLDPVDDDALTRNDITVTRNQGSSVQMRQLTGPLNIQPAPAGVGDYATNYNISLNTDAALNDAAGWRLHLGTVDEPRYPKVKINLRHQTFTSNVNMMNAALTIDIGDRYVINNPPPWMPPDQISQILLGYSETLGIYEHDMELNGAPESPYRMGILDDPVYGHADTDGSTLSGTYPLGTETSLLVATTGTATGSPLWTTSAGDFPFDIAVGGERMTVTNITGGSSPQTFTVTRSVNGVVKPQNNNTDVRLWQPMVMSL